MDNENPSQVKPEVVIATPSKKKLPPNKLLIGVLVTVFVVSVVVVAILLLPSLTRQNTDNSANQTQLHGSDNMISLETIDRELLSEEIVTVTVMVNGVAESVEAQMYGTYGWYITSRGDPERILFCYSSDVDGSLECIYADVDGETRQWCRVADDGSEIDVECDPKAEEHMYVTVRGDLIDIYCANTNYPLATDCVYRRVVTQCRVFFNGNYVDVGCVPTEGIGNYESTQGDLKQIFCTENVGPMATGCLYIEDLPPQQCRMNDGSGDIECEALSTPGRYVTVRGDRIEIECGVPGTPLATDCEYKRVVSMCRVNFNGNTVDVECQAVSDIVGYYESVRGDYKLIYCINNIAPMATECMYYTGVPGDTQTCRMTDGSGDVQCIALTEAGEYETARGDSRNITCTTPGFPLATGCLYAGDIPQPTASPAATSAPRVVATRCRFYRDGAWHTINCTYSGGSFTLNYENPPGFVTIITLNCSNIYAPEASGCNVTGTQRQVCESGGGYATCRSLGGNRYQFFNGTNTTCATPGYPVAMGCVND